MADYVLTRRAWLTLRACLAGAAPLEAREAVASTLLARPDLDPDEKRTWDEWEADR